MSLEPTKAELEILQALWTLGSATVREVNTLINQKRNVNYSSTLKLMQIMFEKGLLTRDETNMKHIYNSLKEEKETKNLLINKFIGNVFDGSASSLVLQILGDQKTSENEIAKIREMLNDIENK